MIINKVNNIEKRFLELTKRIDSGEYRIASNPNDFDAFKRWVETYTFEDKDNIGILTSMIFNKRLRFQIAFQKDIEDKEIDIIYQMIKDILNKEEKDTDLWLYNDNHQLVSGLMSRFNIPIENVYMSHEMMYLDKPIEMDISPLKIIPYSKDILMDTLYLLEDSFVDIARPNEFLNDKAYYHEKFSNKEKSRFSGFLLNDELIGMYYHHDGDIEYVGVKSKYQSKGYGKRIIHHCIKAVDEDSQNHPYLYCVDSNKRAYQFYLREGFKDMAHAARLVVKSK